MNNRTKNRIICLLGLLIICKYAFTQDVTIDELRITTPPAFNILDVEPKTIARPTTPKGLATSLVSAINDSGFKPNLSLEVAPYWLKKKQGITFLQYLNPVGFQSVKQTSSFSIATKQRKVTGNKVEGTELGLGYRTQIFPGQASLKSLQLIKEVSYETLYSTFLSLAKGSKDKDEIKDRLRKAYSDVIAKTIPVQIDGWENDELINFLKKEKFLEAVIALIDKEPQKDRENIDAYLSRLQDKFLTPKKPLELQESLKYRVGWILEVAAASAIAFPTNSFAKEVKHDRLGIWGNLTYRWDNMKDEVSLIARLMQAYSDSVSTNKDLGLSYAHSTKDYSVSLEGIFRFYQFEFDDKDLGGRPIRRVERNNTYKLALNGQYKLSDNVSLTATFGRNFNNALFTSGNLLALLGLNFGLNTKQSLPVK